MDLGIPGPIFLYSDHFEKVNVTEEVCYCFTCHQTHFFN